MIESVDWNELKERAKKHQLSAIEFEIYVHMAIELGERERSI